MGNLFPWDETEDEAGARRFVGFLLWLACVVALGFILAVAGYAHGQTVVSSEVFRSQGSNGQPMVLRIFQTPCEDAAVLKHLLPRVLPEVLVKFKAARLTWEGKDWASCWIEVRGRVYSIDAEGSQFQPIPRSLFLDEAA